MLVAIYPMHPIAHAADLNGMTPRGVSRHPALLAACGILSSPTAEDIKAAEYDMAVARTNTRVMVAGINGTATPAVDLPGVVATGTAATPVATPAKTTRTITNPAAVRTTGTKVARCRIFGYSATAVLRWMGANGWTAEDAGIALLTLGAGAVMPSSIVAGLYDGTVAPKYGVPAPLTPAEVAQLEKARM